MPDEQTDQNKLFFRNLPEGFVVSEGAVERRLLSEYGAVFVARGGVIAPGKIVFEDEAEVSEFQSGLDASGAEIGGIYLELQSVAMRALLTALASAAEAGLEITPRGADSARRNYADTVTLWKSRVEPGLAHWTGKGKLTKAQADSIRALSPHDQVPVVLELEEQGIFFAKDLSKSILYSVAPPGASQHLSLLAFDVAQFDDPVVRRVLADNFWYRTVTSDLPHFTFLGVAESELPGLGLKKFQSGGRDFWIPEI
jgi:hypothetical protein